jgi:hypothetical protein
MPQADLNPDDYNTNIRFFDSSDPQDIKSLTTIVNYVTEHYSDWMEDIKNLSIDDISEWADENDWYRDSPKLFAVVAEPKSPLTTDEHPQEIQGFIYAYPEDDEDNLDYIKEHGLMSNREAHGLIFEISYAKHPDSMKGQIAKALPLAIKKLNKLLKITTNKKSGLPNFTISAYVFDDNMGSAKVLERNAFEKRGQVPGEVGGSEFVDLYVLNWEKFFELFPNT